MVAHILQHATRTHTHTYWTPSSCEHRVPPAPPEPLEFVLVCFSTITRICKTPFFSSWRLLAFVSLCIPPIYSNFCTFNHLTYIQSVTCAFNCIFIYVLSDGRGKICQRVENKNKVDSNCGTVEVWRGKESMLLLLWLLLRSSSRRSNWWHHCVIICCGFHKRLCLLEKGFP